MANSSWLVPAFVAAGTAAVGVVSSVPDCGWICVSVAVVGAIVITRVTVAVAS